MKHVFTLLFALATFSVVNAQTPIYSQNFSGTTLPTGWQNVDNTGTGAGTWARYTTGYSFGSSTASNGHMVFDSDGFGNDTKPEDADLITAAINCTGHSFVALEFQEYFVQYQASEGTVSVSNNGTTWSQVYSVNASSENPHKVKLDISSFAANQATVYIKFNYQGNFDYFWAIDDINIFEPSALDAGVSTITLNQFVGLGNKVVSGVLTNEGATVLTSVNLSYTDNGGAPVAQTFTGLSVLPFQTYSYSFTQPVVMANAALHSIVVNVNTVNGASDLVTPNNTTTKEVTSLSAIPKKNTLVEEFTTAPCQYCPRGTSTIRDIKIAHHDVIGVALHAGFGTDAMTTTDHSTIATAYANGAPTACIDRVFFPGEEKVAVSTNVWESYAVERLAVTTPVSIIADNTYNSSTRELTVNASARFYGPINDDFRINCYIIEDSVTGTGSGYNQVNAYNTVTTSEWYQKGNPIIGFQHRDLARYMFGGAWGSTGVISSPTIDGGLYTKQYTYTLPAAWNDSRVKLVVLVQHYSATVTDRNVLNAIELELNGADSTVATPSVYSSINNITSDVSDINIYPNPASNMLNIQYSVTNDATIGFEVHDMLGRTVQTMSDVKFASGTFGTQLNTSNFENGIYFISVKENGKVINTLRFVVNQ